MTGDDRVPGQRAFRANDNPISFISTRGRRRAKRAMGHKHWVKSRLRLASREMRAIPWFDHRWDCDTCRPYRERSEGDRILEAFVGKKMWLGVIDPDERRKVGRRLRRRGISWVPIPIFGGLEAILATAESDTTATQVLRKETFIREGLMSARWFGAPVRGTRGFLPPARSTENLAYWEAYAAGGRRCWHTHDTEREPRACARRTGHNHGGTCRGWYVRRTSGVRDLGRLELRTRGLTALLTQLRIKFLVDGQGDQQRFAIEPMTPDDPRFVALRAHTKWQPPHNVGDEWALPDIEITIGVNPQTGDLTTANQRRAS